MTHLDPVRQGVSFPQYKRPDLGEEGEGGEGDTAGPRPRRYLQAMQLCSGAEEVNSITR